MDYAGTRFGIFTRTARWLSRLTSFDAFPEGCATIVNVLDPEAGLCHLPPLPAGSSH